MKVLRLTLALGVVALTSGSRLQAWSAVGHRTTTVHAVKLLSGELPGFLQENLDQLAWDSIDPDLMRNYDLPQLREREGPDHYLDLELLENEQLPETRSEFLRLLGSRKADLTLDQVGALPYSVVEVTQRLTLAFAQHRRQPADEHLQAKAVINAAYVAHYAADLCQPLHTTIHHDGRALQDYSSPHTGIHRQVDALIERLRPPAAVNDERLEPRLLKPLFPAVVEELMRSHAALERLYDLEDDLEVLEAGGQPSDRLVALTLDRYRASVRFTSSLILTAWRESADLQIPEWGLPDQSPAD